MIQPNKIKSSFHFCISIFIVTINRQKLNISRFCLYVIPIQLFANRFFIFKKPTPYQKSDICMAAGLLLRLTVCLM